MSRPEMTEEKRQRLLAQLERGRKTRAANLAKKRKELEEIKAKNPKTVVAEEEDNKEEPNENKPKVMNNGKVMREKNHKCPCGKKYTSGTMLRRHQKTCLYFQKMDAEDREVEDEMRKIAKERVMAKKKKQYEELQKEPSDDEDEEEEEEVPEVDEPEEPEEPVKLQKPKKKKQNVIISHKSPVAQESPVAQQPPRNIPPPSDPIPKNIVPSAKPIHPPRYTLEEYQTMAQQRQENERRRAQAEAQTRRNNKIKTIAMNMSAGGLMC